MTGTLTSFLEEVNKKAKLISLPIFFDHILLVLYYKDFSI